MLHGNAGSLENFAANIAAHAEHFNCIAFDMIGSGMTAKPGPLNGAFRRNAY
jgi:2-hydroxy-6-oxonona-2,4-dienedioate hydrolase